MAPESREEAVPEQEPSPEPESATPSGRKPFDAHRLAMIKLGREINARAGFPSIPR